MVELYYILDIWFDLYNIDYVILNLFFMDLDVLMDINFKVEGVKNMLIVLL